MVTYAQLEDMQEYLGTKVNPGADGRLQSALEASSRAIDLATKRPEGAWAPSEAEETRTFLVDSCKPYKRKGLQLLRIDEFCSVPSAVLGRRAWADDYEEIAVDTYEVYPITADDSYSPGDMLPKAAVALASEDLYLWSNYRRVRITAFWGYPETPADIHEACKMQAARMFERRGFMSGAGGVDVTGQATMPVLDADVEKLVRHRARILVK